MIKMILMNWHSKNWKWGLWIQKLTKDEKIFKQNTSGKTFYNGISKVKDYEDMVTRMFLVIGLLRIGVMYPLRKKA